MKSLHRLKRCCIAGVLLTAATIARGEETIPLTIGAHPLAAEIAETPEERRRGLSLRQSLPENRGMLFIFATTDHHAMWMRDTLIPLSVAFIDKQGIIVNVERMEPMSDQIHRSSRHVRFALEMPAGWFADHGIAPGMRVEGIPAREER